jgi:predicted DNA-binding protein (MmcQ/YjbR family)
MCVQGGITINTLSTDSVDTIREHLLNYPSAREQQPFGPQAYVYKVKGKMFALFAWNESPPRITLKCDPDDALALRDAHPAIAPGAHMNHKHWNTVSLDDSLEASLIEDMIEQSYQLVVKGLKKSDQAALAEALA